MLDLTKINLNDYNTQEELDDLACELFPTEQNCEGTPEECFISGWVNAKDIQDGKGHILSDSEFKDYAFSEVRNMYPELLNGK